MAHVAYINGRYILHADAVVHVEDRGYQFSGGIYEYVAFYNRRLLDGDGHLKRMEHSLKELSISMPMVLGAMKQVMQELIRRNSREDGGLYIQITRGVARRDHPFPRNTKPALIMTVCASRLAKENEVKNGVSVITHADQRWDRRDIKSISLLANVIAKQAATARKCREAWLLEGDTITEGAVSNSYIIDKSGTLITHPLNEHILGGITREVVLKLARKANIPVEERAFSLGEAHGAAEAFLTSTSANILPVVRIDEKTVGNGKPGAVTAKLLSLYSDHVFKQTGKRIACL